MTPAKQSAIQLNHADNVAIAVCDLMPGTAVTVGERAIQIHDRIGLGHKFAVAGIVEGEPVRKFGQIIGFASQSIQAGKHVHTHNVSCDRFARDYAFATAVPGPPVADREYSFDGYLRPDGRVGTRNYVAVVSSVNCSATVCSQIVERFRDVTKSYPNVDGVFAVTHKTGCGMSVSGTDLTYLQRTLFGFAHHPNVFDYVMIGLGCETNQPSDFVPTEEILGKSSSRPRVLSIQALGGIGKSVEAGVRAVREILPRANDVRRTRQPVSRILLGTNCGGSDGNSGITANPALGIASDFIVAQGGTSILAETPEIYGAEHLLTRRAVTPAVGEKLIERIKWWEWYTAIFGAEINNNPSPGNKAGGLTTIYEKSLGAVAKGGSTALTAVYEYAEPVTAKGLVVMDTPGLDPVSVTGIVAGGANVVVFTTGRGSVFGCKPTPSIKVATNTPMYEHMIDDMDVDAGIVLTGTPVEVVGRQIFETILAVANGQRTKSELHGAGEEEFAPWIVGPVL
jgi:altronate hydrolase